MNKEKPLNESKKGQRGNEQGGVSNSLQECAASHIRKAQKDMKSARAVGLESETTCFLWLSV